MRIAQTETAIDAFHAHHSKSSQQRTRILEFIKQRGSDWSIGELANAMGLQKSTLSARIRESLDDGELIIAKNRKDRVSGITIRPVMIPPIQMEIF